MSSPDCKDQGDLHINKNLYLLLFLLWLALAGCSPDPAINAGAQSINTPEPPPTAVPTVNPNLIAQQIRDRLTATMSMQLQGCDPGDNCDYYNSDPYVNLGVTLTNISQLNVLPITPGDIVTIISCH